MRASRTACSVALFVLAATPQTAAALCVIRSQGEMKKYNLIPLMFFSGCANYYEICDAPKKGCNITKPTDEVVGQVGEYLSKETTVELIWFVNDDGRYRLCQAYPKKRCAGAYRTAKKNDGGEELMVSLCTNPY